MTAPLARLDQRLGSPVSRATHRLGTRPARAARGLRWGTWLAVVVLTLAVLAAGVYVVTAILGSLLGGRTTPIAVEWLYIGALLTAAVLGVAIAFVVWALGVIVFRRYWRAHTITATAVTVLLGALPGELESGPGRVSYLDKQGQRSSGSVHDILVVVDPADPAGVESSRGLRRRTPGPPRAGAPTRCPTTSRSAWSFRRMPLRGRSEAWSFVEPPTTTGGTSLESVGRIAPTESAPPPARTSLLSTLRASLTSPGATAHAAPSH